MEFFYWIGIGFFIVNLICGLMVTFLDRDLNMVYAEWFGVSIENLKDKVIWITGASSGIGEQLAITCGGVGSKLILSARRKEELERVKDLCIAKSCGKLNPTDVLVLPMDINETKKHQQLFDNVLNHFGNLDILVNNAGRSQRATWEDIELDVDRSMFELNVFSLINLSRIAAKYFLKKNHGHIAVTSSTAGVMGVPFSGTYTATKHALHGYFSSLRSENFGSNLDISLFCPGPTHSNFLQECYTEKTDKKYGEVIGSGDKRMTAERCGYLFAVCIVNKIDEAWIAIPPIVLLYYLNTYFPNMFKKIFKILGTKAMAKLREGNEAEKFN